MNVITTVDKNLTHALIRIVSYPIVQVGVSLMQSSALPRLESALESKMMQIEYGDGEGDMGGEQPPQETEI